VGPSDVVIFRQFRTLRINHISEINSDKIDQENLYQRQVEETRRTEKTEFGKLFEQPDIAVFVDKQYDTDDETGHLYLEMAVKKDKTGENHRLLSIFTSPLPALYTACSRR
jgi:hypothetical protein